MKHINLDTADEQVKQFIQTLPVEPDGVELELGGKIICKVVGPQKLADVEQEAVIARGREVVKQARQRNRVVSARTIEREVQQAVDEVRGHATDQRRTRYERRR